MTSEITCEGCGRTATTRDPEGVDLCPDCSAVVARSWVDTRRAEGRCALLTPDEEPCERTYGHPGRHVAIGVAV